MSFKQCWSIVKNNLYNGPLPKSIEEIIRQHQNKYNEKIFFSNYEIVNKIKPDMKFIELSGEQLYECMEKKVAVQSLTNYYKFGIIHTISKSIDKTVIKELSERINNQINEDNNVNIGKIHKNSQLPNSQIKLSIPQTVSDSIYYEIKNKLNNQIIKSENRSDNIEIINKQLNNTFKFNISENLGINSTSSLRELSSLLINADIDLLEYKPIKPYFERVSEDNDVIRSTMCPANIRDLFEGRIGYKISVPNKVVTVLRDYCSITNAIYKNNNDLNVELCLIFISLLARNPTDENLKNKYMQISSESLKELFNSTKYIKIKNVLLNGSEKSGPIILCDDKSEKKVKCYGYKLADNYYQKGWCTYELKSPKAKDIYFKSVKSKLIKALENSLSSKILHSYESIKLPSSDEIKTEAKRLVGIEYKNSKGKRLVSLNKKKKENRLTNLKSKHGKNSEFSFVEESIKKYKSLTKPYIIPSIGDKKSGGRVVDSFTLMPSWIRNLVKIDGQPIRQYDFTALHPNICLKLYATGEEKERLEGDVHTKLAEKFNTDRNTIKIENLSFFNKQYRDMLTSPLWEMYCNEAPVMMDNIINEKDSSPYKHKVTSMNLFKFEVNLMTEIVKKLNDEQKIIYVYDAIYGIDDNIALIMNTVAADFGLGTRVSLPEN